MTWLYKTRILTPVQLKRLSEHKYACTNISILDPFLQPWWCWLTSIMPLWIAPNLITIIGLIVNIITTLILVSYSPDGKEFPPRWTCFVCALGLFIYQSLDAIDGKQARRTYSSSPLGELFDHGCDSISTVFVALSACVSCQLGVYPNWMFFQCFCAITLFYCAHWQTYVSGTLRFGKVDVTEAQLTIIVIHMISAIFGPEIWMSKIIGNIELWTSLVIMTIICGLWSLSKVWSVIMAGGVGKNGSTVAIPIVNVTWSYLTCMIFFSGYFQNLISFLNMFVVGGVGKNGSTVAIPYVDLDLRIPPLYFAFSVYGLLAYRYARVIITGGCGKNGSTVAGTSVLSPIIPLSLVVGPAFIIAQKSPNDLFGNHPSLYTLAFGMIAAKVTNKLVIAHMTRSEMEYLDSGLIGPLILFLNQYFNCFLPELPLLWFTLLWALQDLFRYCTQVCLEICDHLHIKLFKIPYPPKPPANQNLTGTNSGHGTTILSGNVGGVNNLQDKNGTHGTQHRKQTKTSKKH